MGALMAVKRRLGCVGFVSGSLHICDQSIQIIYNECGVCLARRAKIFFYAEVKLDAPRLEPCAAALCKVRRLGDLRESQLLNIESTRLVFFTGGHRNLDVINGEDFHGVNRQEHR